MTKEEMENWLEEKISFLPKRTSGEAGYEYIIKEIQKVFPHERKSLVLVLKDWLKLRKEPLTMLATEIAEKYHLNELIDDIRSLLKDVEEGKVFKAFYTKFIRKSLLKLKK